MSCLKLAAYLLVVSLALAGDARAASVHLVASSDAIRVGDELTISLEISGLGAGSGDSLGAFDVDVRFDQDLLQLTSFSFVDPILGSNPLDLVELGALPFLGDVLVNGGVLDAFGVSGNGAEVLDRDQVGTFRFFTASFVALQPGLASAMLDLVDPELVFAGSAGAVLDAVFGVSGVSVRIAAQDSVPEPSAAGCLGLACIALLLGRGRLRRYALAALTVSFASLPLAASAQTSSPFPPDPEALGRYVVNGGPGLDTGCTFRSAGPLIINLKVPATMSPQSGVDKDGKPISRLTSEGKLMDAKTLVANGVIDAHAMLRFPVFDIDSSAMEPGFAPEVDEIRFNGTLIGTLDGMNNEWTEDTMPIPIEEVRFATESNPDVTNELRIDIDVANEASGREVWCMAVDWLAVEFGAALPYVLVHGIAADETTWEGDDAVGVLAELDSRGVLHKRFSLEPNGETSTNARLLRLRIEGFLDVIKADRVHVIAHSKGGLDTQRMAALAPAPQFTVETLSTLSTPHLGSVAADLSLIKLQPADDLLNTGRDPNGYVAAYLRLAGILNGINGLLTFFNSLNNLPEVPLFGPQLPGLGALTVDRAIIDRKAGLRGNIPLTFTVSADADLNEDGDIGFAEPNPLFDPRLELAARPGRTAWRVLRDFSRARIVGLQPAEAAIGSGAPVGPEDETLFVYETIETDTPQANDIVVTKMSATPDYGFPLVSVRANHSSVKNGVIIRIILNRTIRIR